MAKRDVADSRDDIGRETDSVVHCETPWRGRFVVVVAAEKQYEDDEPLRIIELPPNLLERPRNARTPGLGVVPRADDLRVKVGS